MNKLICLTNRLLNEYSPIGMAILVIPFFLPIDPHTQRRLLLVFCALPGMLLAILNPKTVFKNPVHLLIILFVAYFSAEDIWGMLPIPSIKQSIVLAAIIIGPAILLSFSTPNRKLYSAAIGLILLVAAIRFTHSMVSFYADAPFPEARFAGLGHPVSSSQVMGFTAVLGGAFFLQNGRKFSRWDWLPLLCFPILLAATLYTHSRSATLALALTAATALLGIRNRLKKTLILYAVAAATFSAYLVSFQLPERPDSPVVVTSSKPPERPTSSAVESSLRPPEKPAYQAVVTSLKLPESPASPAVATSFKTPESSASPAVETRASSTEPASVYDIRSKGIISSGERQTASSHARLDIWKDLFSRMKTPQDWLIGHGLGYNVLIKNPSPEAARWYYPTPKGYTILPHSGYLWSLYHGGLIGLTIFLALLTTAGWSARRAGSAGYVVFALLVFCAAFFLVDGQRILIGKGSEYLMFWIPVGLAAGFPLLMKKDTGGGGTD